MSTPHAPSQDAWRAARRLAWLRGQLGELREEDACLVAVGRATTDDGARVALANATVAWDTNHMTTRVLLVDGTAIDYQGTMGEESIARSILCNWGVSFHTCSLRVDLVRTPSQWEALPAPTLERAWQMCDMLAAQEAHDALLGATHEPKGQAPGSRL